MGYGITHDEYNVRGIAYARPYRKDDIYVLRQQEQSFTCIREWKQGTKSPKFCAKGAFI